jgi:hypothetical protein
MEGTLNIYNVGNETRHDDFKLDNLSPSFVYTLKRE